MFFISYVCIMFQKSMPVMNTNFFRSFLKSLVVALCLMSVFSATSATPSSGRRAAKTTTITLSDFISRYNTINVEYEKLKKKGFTVRAVEDAEVVTDDILQNGEITIEHTADFDDHGSGFRRVDIWFPKVEDARSFVMPLMKNQRWSRRKTSSGEYFKMKKWGSVRVTRENSTVVILDGEE